MASSAGVAPSAREAASERAGCHQAAACDNTLMSPQRRLVGGESVTPSTSCLPRDGTFLAECHNTAAVLRASEGARRRLEHPT